MRKGFSREKIETGVVSDILHRRTDDEALSWGDDILEI